MNIRDESALAITSGQELEKFNLGTTKVYGVEYEVLTGWEVFPNTCWWCGELIEQRGKCKRHYCPTRSRNGFESCFRKYWNHFRWDSASAWATRRAGYCCQNCGSRGGLQVHHIVPLRGGMRFFTAFNLPWNLVVLCHECHLKIHAIMEMRKTLSVWERAEIQGQAIMKLV